MILALGLLQEEDVLGVERGLEPGQQGRRIEFVGDSDTCAFGVLHKRTWLEGVPHMAPHWEVRAEPTGSLAR